MLDVQLDKNYKLTSDKHNYILAERSKSKNKDGEYSWNNIKWANSIEHILISYKEVVIRESNCKTLEEILKLSKDIDNTIQKLMS